MHTQAIPPAAIIFTTAKAVTSAFASLNIRGLVKSGVQEACVRYATAQTSTSQSYVYTARTIAGVLWPMWCMTVVQKLSAA